MDYWKDELKKRLLSMERQIKNTKWKKDGTEDGNAVYRIRLSQEIYKIHKVTLTGKVIAIRNNHIVVGNYDSIAAAKKGVNEYVMKLEKLPRHKRNEE